ncbi:hypothetical protein IWQ60_009733 [Tieghemiomyces parasiticus]|uniref:Bromo domain-containing protein n=1 Tax=Tieghemiomyces parasiticus TaxID=78921 RepID=A0A9W7ZTP4_9FUNG|nr:hypothetical protein IWQ60_009733 [Tieghemiomyces parasiticus]
MYAELVDQFPHVTPSHLLDTLISVTRLPALGSAPFTRDPPYTLTTLLGSCTIRDPPTRVVRNYHTYLDRTRVRPNRIPPACPIALLRNYEELVCVHGHKYASFCVMFDQTGLRLITGSDDFLIKVWCARSGYLINTLRGHQDVITDISINEENTLLATAAQNGVIRVFTMATGAPAAVLRLNVVGTRKSIACLLFSPSPISDARFMLAGCQDGMVRLWRWSRRHLTFSDEAYVLDCRTGPRDAVLCAAFNNTGSHFAVASSDGVIRVFSTVADLTTAAVDISARRSYYHAPAGGATRVPDDDLSARLDHRPKLVARLEGHTGDVTALLYARDNYRILSSSADGTARVWTFQPEAKAWTSVEFDMRTAGPELVADTAIVLSESQNPPAATSPHLAHRTPGAPLGTASADPSGEGHDSQPPADAETAPPPPGTSRTFPVTMAIWSQHDRYVIIACSMGTVRVFDSTTGYLHHALIGHTDEVYVIAITPLSERVVMTAGYDGRIILWDIEAGTKLREFRYADRRFFDGRFSGDGYQFAVTDEYGACLLFGLGCNPAQFAAARQFGSQMFMSDYMPTVLDVNGNVVDELYQIAPHLLPKGPIRDFDGREYAAQKPPGYGLRFPTDPAPGIAARRDLTRLVQLYDELNTPEAEGLVTATIPALAARRKRGRAQGGNVDAGVAETAGDAEDDPLAIEAPIYPLPDDEDDEDFHGSSAGGESASDTDPYGDRGAGIYFDDEAMEDNGFDPYEEDGFDSDGERYGSSTGARGFGAIREARRRRKRRRSRSDTDGSATDESISTALARNRNSSSRRLPPAGPSSTRQRRSQRRSRRGPPGELDDADSPSSSEGSSPPSSSTGRQRLRRQRTQRSYIESSDSEPELNYSDASLGDAPSRGVDLELGHPSPASAVALQMHHQRSAQIYTDSSDSDGLSGGAQSAETPPAPSLSHKRREKLPALYDSDSDNQAGSSSAAGASHKRPVRAAGKMKPTGSDGPIWLKVNLRKSRVQLASDSEDIQASAATSEDNDNVDDDDGPSPPVEMKSEYREGDDTTGSTPEPLSLYSATGAAGGLGDWVGDNAPKVTPYKPQVGDLVAYFAEGHRQFLKASPLASQFRVRTVTASTPDVTFAEIHDVQYRVGPPTWCQLTLQDIIVAPEALTASPEPPAGAIDVESSEIETPESSSVSSSSSSSPRYIPPPFTRTGKPHTLEFHDIDTNPDFIVLLAKYQAAARQKLRVGDAVVAFYNDSERYPGRIVATKSVSATAPHLYGDPSDKDNVANSLQENYSVLQWQQFQVEWNPPSHGPAEWLSPWELVRPDTSVSETPLKEEEGDSNSGEDSAPRLPVCALTCPTTERLPKPVADMCRDLVGELRGDVRYEVFVEHVDFAAYPSYLSAVAYPMCLDSVSQRLVNKYYRRIEAVTFDINLIQTNANLFNEPQSAIARAASKLVKTFQSQLRERLRPLRKLLLDVSSGDSGSGGDRRHTLHRFTRAQYRSESDDYDEPETGTVPTGEDSAGELSNEDDTDAVATGEEESADGSDFGDVAARSRSARPSGRRPPPRGLYTMEEVDDLLLGESEDEQAFIASDSDGGVSGQRRRRGRQAKRAKRQARSEKGRGRPGPPVSSQPLRRGRSSQTEGSVTSPTGRPSSGSVGTNRRRTKRRRLDSEDEGSSDSSYH